MLYINERTGNIINVRVPVHGGGWRPYGAAHAAPGVAPVSQDPPAENAVQGPENGLQDDAPAPAAEQDAETKAAESAPAAPGPKKPAPRPSAPKKPAAKKSTAKKPAAKRASTSSRKTAK